MCLHVQSRDLVRVSGVHCHVRASSTSGCAFVYFTVQYGIEYYCAVSLFQAQDVRKHTNSRDVAGPAKKHQELEAQRKDEEGQEEVTAELKRFTRWEMARGFYLFEGTAAVPG